MKAKKAKIVCLIFLVTLLLLLLGYCGLSYYYSRGFSYGTWINGIYCTGKSVAEVNAELIAQTVVQDLRLTDSDGQQYIIELDKVNFDIDYTGQLKGCIREQNPALWVDRLSGQVEEQVNPKFTFDSELLRQEINNSFPIIKASLREQKVEIYRENNGYELYNGMTQVLNVEKVTELAENALSQGVFEINLAESGCYEDLPLTEEMQETQALYEKIKAFQKCGIVYDMGDALIEISPDITADWITLDENGNFLLDEQGKLILQEEGISSFIEELAAEYDTYGSVRTFHATRGEDIQIEGGNYGNQLNQKAEVKYLTEAYLNGVSETHIPVYKKQAMVRGKNDIGDTYIEIDITMQKMYYYQDGEKVIETDVVTGNMRRKNGTPSGVNYVYNKQRNRILRGEDYASPVKYWMPVKGAIGIHDASWRKKFGGDIYLTNGSHGCINTPTEIMTELYEMVEIGTPVVMFY